MNRPFFVNSILNKQIIIGAFTRVEPIIDYI